jgi:hypothetical protein
MCWPTTARNRYPQPQPKGSLEPPSKADSGPAARVEQAAGGLPPGAGELGISYR